MSWIVPLELRWVGVYPGFNCLYFLAAMASTLQIVVDRLSQTEVHHYAFWVVSSPFPDGYSHHDRAWDTTMAELWHQWQEFFSLRYLPQALQPPTAYLPQGALEDEFNPLVLPTLETGTTSERLMQGLGIGLWDWIFRGPLGQTLDRSLGIAEGRGEPLRLQLEVRPPELIGLPWEIMQPQPGRPPLALEPKILFSRSTSAVDGLFPRDRSSSLQVLLVLGEEEGGDHPSSPQELQLSQEATILKTLLEESLPRLSGYGVTPGQVSTLVQPDREVLLRTLQQGRFNVLVYAGHGVPAADGGLLLLSPGVTLSGTELAHSLVRAGVKLAVLNTCWGAQPDYRQAQVIPRSSLAEVLLHHGVPAVIAMRDSIADQEALSFIQTLAQGLVEGQSVPRAVAKSRQHLLSLYGLNHPAWTLPVLYQHPQFDGALISLDESVTRLPDGSALSDENRVVRCWKDPSQLWPIRGGILRIGRLATNDLVIAEPWVSSHHAEIFHRNSWDRGRLARDYYLRDLSRYGTYYFDGQTWHHLHRQEVVLSLGALLRFGSPQGMVMEFTVDIQ